MMPDPSISIVVVDDNAQVRTGLNALLKGTGGFSVRAVAADGKQAIDVVSRERPDVVLMDVGMPVMDGIEACQRIRKLYPAVKVVMLTCQQSKEDVFASLAAGANGYCLKDVDFDRLVTAIRAVARGDLWLDSQIAGELVDLARSGTRSKDRRKPEGTVFAPLSPREMEVLNLVVDGLSNPEIAEKLSISLDTAKTHIRHIMDKLAVSDRTQMAVKALRNGLI